MDVKTAGRTLDLFELFASAKKPMTLSEIARAINAPQSSCFNLVRALEARGYLYSVGGKKRLYPTRRMFDCARAIISFEPALSRIEPLLESLRDETDETVILGTRQGDKVIYLAVAEGRQTIRYISRVGEIKMLHASAIGKALLMTLDPARRAEIVNRIELAKLTTGTITRRESLLEEIDAAERCGFTRTSGEGVSDVSAVAAPLIVDQIVYGIAIAGPSARMDAKIDALGELLKHKVTRLS